MRRSTTRFGVGQGSIGLIGGQESQLAFEQRAFSRSQELAARALEIEPHNSIAFEMHNAAVKAGRNDVTTRWYDERAKAIRAMIESDGELKIPQTAILNLDQATWEKANPSLDVTVKRDYLEAQCRAAVAEPRKQNAFKRLHLNVWTRQSEVWIPVEWWKACPRLPDTLAGLPVAGGLDLSSTTDLTAFEQK